MIGSTYEGLTVDDQSDRLVVTLCRPEVRNAINLAMVKSLHRVCSRLEDSPRTAIITGTGSFFAAGADIAELVHRGRVEALAGINSTLFERISALPMPTVAAVNGPAIGGGAELACACDFRIGTPDSKFANPEGQLGILAGAGATWRLKELIGEPLAKELLLAGRTLNADEALEAHLFNDVVPAESLMETANTWVDRINRNAPLALRLAKTAIQAPRASHPLIDTLAQAVLFETEEKSQRMLGFLTRQRKA